MPAHIHAELMAQYAQDAMETDRPWERWQVRQLVSTQGERKYHEWCDCARVDMTFPLDFEYRRKPRTININGHEVPEPEREVLKEGSTYWVARFEYELLCDYYTWRNDELDYRWLKRGLIHLTEDAAVTHAKALLSFTENRGAGDE